MVVPTVVQEVDAAVERGADDANALLFVGRNAYVVAAESHQRDAFSRAAQVAIRDVVLLACRQKLGTGQAGDKRGANHSSQELSPC